MCDRRGWRLLAVAARTTHIHVVVNAPDVAPERVMQQLKAWSTRAVLRVRPDEGPGLWTRHGSTRYLWAADEVAEKVQYVEHEQDGPGAARRHEAMVERFKGTEPRA